MAYFGFGEDSHNDKFLEAGRMDLQNKDLLNFFKPMNSRRKPLNYDLYSESEWRILLFPELLNHKKIIDPRNPANDREHTYFRSLKLEQQAKLKYLIPLDGWFAIIICPSLEVKSGAQWDAGIIDQIRTIKSKQHDHGNRVEGRGRPKKGNLPIEVNLDACKNF